MKAEFTKDGYIKITPEDLPEKFALAYLLSEANKAPMPPEGFSTPLPVLIVNEVPFKEAPVPK